MFRIITKKSLDDLIDKNEKQFFEIADYQENQETLVEQLKRMNEEIWAAKRVLSVSMPWFFKDPKKSPLLRSRWDSNAYWGVARKGRGGALYFIPSTLSSTKKDAIQAYMGIWEGDSTWKQMKKRDDVAVVRCAVIEVV